jgi:hypothetical protein
MDRQEFLDSVCSRVWDKSLQPKDKPRLPERMLALKIMLQRLKKESDMVIGGKKINYFGIDDVEQVIAECEWLFRILIQPSITSAEMLETKVFNPKLGALEAKDRIFPDYRAVAKLHVRIVNMDIPEENQEFEWLDDGDDLTKAGSFVVKYFYLKFAHVSGEGDLEPLDSKREGEQTASVAATQVLPSQQQASRAAEVPAKAPVRTPAPEKATPPMPITPSQPDGASDQTKRNRIDALVWLGGELPNSESNWMRGKIVPEITMFERRKAAGTLTAEESENYKDATGIRFIFDKITAEHRKQCGDSCPHIIVALTAIKTGGTIHDALQEAVKQS